MKAGFLTRLALAAAGCAAAVACASGAGQAQPAAPRVPSGQDGSPAAWVQLASPGVVRLHVMAHSDRQDDQRVKAEVARAVLAELRRLYAQAPLQALEGADGYLAYLDHNRGRLARAARDALLRAARSALQRRPVRVETGVAYFPFTAGPDGQIYPPGWYRTVRVIIGSGHGHNWWCMVFPSLCPFEPSDEAGTPRAHAAPARAEGRSAVSTPAPPAGADGPRAGVAHRPWWARLLPWHWF